jgi:hypothetical protein
MDGTADRVAADADRARRRAGRSTVRSPRRAGLRAVMGRCYLLVRFGGMGHAGADGGGDGITGATLTHHLNAMEAQGLVERPGARRPTRACSASADRAGARLSSVRLPRSSCATTRDCARADRTRRSRNWAAVLDKAPGRVGARRPRRRRPRSRADARARSSRRGATETGGACRRSGARLTARPAHARPAARHRAGASRTARPAPLVVAQPEEARVAQAPVPRPLR